MAKIDNDKMWAYLLRVVEVPFSTYIKQALRAQKLKYNPETKEIESTESEFKIEVGKWYKCIKDFRNPERDRRALIEGKVYKAIEPNAIYGEYGLFVINHDGKAADYFCPATEEEMPPSECKLVEAVANEPVEQKPKFKIGDLIKPFIFQNHYGTHQRRIIEIRDGYYFTSIYNEKLSIDDVDSCFGLIEKNEEPELSHSEVTKESNQELTEFEEEFLAIVDSWCHGDGRVYKDCNKQVLKDARLLISIARKQLQPEFDVEIEQAYKNQDDVVYNKGYDKGFEDARKRFIEEAVSWLRDQLMNKYQNGILQCLRDDRAAFILNDFRKALEKEE